LGFTPLLSGAVLATQPAQSIHSPWWPENPPAIATDALQTRISQLPAETTLGQKVGQLPGADIGSITPDDFRHRPLRSILNGGSPSPGNNEFSPPSEWRVTAARFYESSSDIAI
jgi:beta-glucosidase